MGEEGGELRTGEGALLAAFEDLLDSPAGAALFLTPKMILESLVFLVDGFGVDVLGVAAASSSIIGSSPISVSKLVCKLSRISVIHCGCVCWP